MEKASILHTDEGSDASRRNSSLDVNPPASLLPLKQVGLEGHPLSPHLGRPGLLLSWTLPAQGAVLGAKGCPTTWCLAEPIYVWVTGKLCIWRRTLLLPLLGTLGSNKNSCSAGVALSGDYHQGDIPPCGTTGTWLSDPSSIFLRSEARGSCTRGVKTVLLLRRSGNILPRVPRGPSLHPPQPATHKAALSQELSYA